MSRARVASLFYLGTLISSVGSFAFNTAMIAFMLKSGFHLWNASLILGMNRLLYVLVMTSFGHVTDKVSARTVVFVTEVIAAVASLCLYLLWSGADTNYPLFALFCITRGAVVSFQTGSRAKIAKLLSDESYAQNSKNAIWLNKATQGATLFGGLIGYTIIEHFDFRVAIVLDGLTFLTNGFFTLFLPSFDSKPAAIEEKISWHRKFKDFFKFNKQAASLDVVLAIIMMGTGGDVAEYFKNFKSEIPFLYCKKPGKNEKGHDNTHPTVKPIHLMRYLAKMVTPPAGVVLDPFMGSGTTGVAALHENFDFIGIERDNNYRQIAEKRLKGVLDERAE